MYLGMHLPKLKMVKQYNRNQCAKQLNARIPSLTINGHQLLCAAALCAKTLVRMKASLHE